MGGNKSKPGKGRSGKKYLEGQNGGSKAYTEKNNQQQTSQPRLSPEHGYNPQQPVQPHQDRNQSGIGYGQPRVQQSAYWDGGYSHPGSRAHGQNVPQGTVHTAMETHPPQQEGQRHPYDSKPGKRQAPDPSAVKSSEPKDNKHRKKKEEKKKTKDKPDGKKKEKHADHATVTGDKDLEEENEDLAAQLEKSKKDIEAAEKRLKNELIQKDEQMKRTAELESTLRSLEQERNELLTTHKDFEAKEKRLKNELRQKDEQLKSEEKHTAQYENKLRNLEQEKSELLTRLSAAVGAKLTDNNADIADLSDSNRPTKLAEHFSELYDNQWTEAFESLDKGKGNEQNTCALLLKLFVRTYSLCREKASHDLDTLHEAIASFNGNKPTAQIIKQMKEDRKKNYRSQVENMKKHIKTHVADLLPGNIKGPVDVYLMRCVEICWLMAVQDPPVFVKTDTDLSNQALDPQLYRAYTTSGKYIDYIVWPVLYLHDGGGVLCKGVAQGKREKRKGKTTNPGTKSPVTKSKDGGTGESSGQSQRMSQTYNPSSGSTQVTHIPSSENNKPEESGRSFASAIPAHGSSIKSDKTNPMMTSTSSQKGTHRNVINVKM